MTDRELDALVAEEIFKVDVSKPCTGLMIDAANGSSWSCSACGWYDDHGAAEHKPIPRHYSTDISAAMEVVEKIAPPKSAKDSEFIRWFRATTCPSGWLVEFESGDAGGPYETVSALNKSLPRAICLTALSTVGEKNSAEE